MATVKHSGKASARDFEGTKLEALVELMFLAAYADGDFGDEERAHFARSVESLTDARLGGEELSRLLDRIDGAVSTEGRAKRLAALKDRLSDPGSRRGALALALDVMAADGILRTTERELILEVAEALEIDRDVAADMVKEVAP